MWLSRPNPLRFGRFLKYAVAVRAFHHETPAQALPTCSRVVEVGKWMGHGGDTFTRSYLPAACSLILARQPIRQSIQRWVQGAWHVGVSGLGAAQRGGGVWGQFADKWREEVSVAGLCRLHQTVHVDVELLLLKGAGEDAVGEVLHPGEQWQVHVVAAVTAQHVDAKKDLALSDLLTRCLALCTRKSSKYKVRHKQLHQNWSA